MAQGLNVASSAGPLRLDVNLEKAASIEVKLAEKGRVLLMAVPVRARGILLPPSGGAAPLAQLRGIPPGEYVVTAWKADQEVAYREEDVQERIRQRGVRVTVVAGGTAQVELGELLQ